MDRLRDPSVKAPLIKCVGDVMSHSVPPPGARFSSVNGMESAWFASSSMPVLNPLFLCFEIYLRIPPVFLCLFFLFFFFFFWSIRCPRYALDLDGKMWRFPWGVRAGAPCPRLASLGLGPDDRVVRL